jgi:predicted KAP-like P-loop ATPase
MKHSDRPILRPREDVLGRSKFSLALARAIDGLVVAKDGFVIAIIGEWGAGKSSVIEMTLRYLTHLEMERESKRGQAKDDGLETETLDTIEPLAEIYDLIRDRVAAYDTSNQAFSKARYDYRLALFRTWLGTAEDAAKANTYWNLLQRVQNNRRTTLVRFSPWLISGRAELATALLSELARALGEKLGSEINEAFASVLERLAELAPIAGAGLDIATGTPVGRLVSASGNWSAKLAAKLTSGPTLDELRENLRTLLRGLSDQRILIIIDDLDRLTPREATEMVSLVKSLGDLPNVIYLLGFDEDNLVTLVHEDTKLDGHEFLRKIIQYPVHLPPILGNGLSRVWMPICQSF